MRAAYHKYILNFKTPSGTSRGVMTTKETWIIVIEQGTKKGIGECGILRGLSVDDRPDYEAKLRWVCQNIESGLTELLAATKEFPSIQFGIETAFASLESSTGFDLFPSDFTSGKAAIPINGLIWMGDPDFMKSQIEEKLAQGFDCIKMKIGAIDFEEEFKLLASIRSTFSATDIELRVDANGAFSATDALAKLKRLATIDLHSIEQPIRQGQLKAMADLCKQTPLPIALDEELIGVFDVTEKEKLLLTIQPQFIILKPSLVGGFSGTKEWIQLAEQLGIGWWITSALESNIGLNAIAQFTYTFNNPMPQGLGTGGLYTNNFKAPLVVNNGELNYNPEIEWTINFITK
ncbi:o-succinylbenzoate synthase [Aquimarina brevivitae]|uniref:O-succinylbenzoate synthase n=1 Tax=Aquimarina brevivitae TaxID=323412 RepID=A0A4Q7P2R3_9FLAO|nr:o-succinylbenzoate synthase [Aquimarina brevivitae]RZS93907.1 o-succinylbenzoate synthase [Aquimarina brevivitae]